MPRPMMACNASRPCRAQEGGAWPALHWGPRHRVNARPIGDTGTDAARLKSARGLCPVPAPSWVPYGNKAPLGRSTPPEPMVLTQPGTLARGPDRAKRQQTAVLYGSAGPAAAAPGGGPPGRRISGRSHGLTYHRVFMRSQTLSNSLMHAPEIKSERGPRPAGLGDLTPCPG